MRDEPQRGAFVQVHFIGSSSHTFLSAHHSAWTLDETGPIFDSFTETYEIQRSFDAEDICMYAQALLYLLLLERMRIFPKCCAPSHFYRPRFIFFNSLLLGLVSKIDFCILCLQRPGKQGMWASILKVDFKANKQPPHLSLQVSFALQRQLSVVVVDSVQNTTILHPCCGKAEWFLMFPKGDLPLYKAFFF